MFSYLWFEVDLNKKCMSSTSINYSLHIRKQSKRWVKCTINAAEDLGRLRLFTAVWLLVNFQELDNLLTACKIQCEIRPNYRGTLCNNIHKWVWDEQRVYFQMSCHTSTLQSKAISFSMVVCNERNHEDDLWPLWEQQTESRAGLGKSQACRTRQRSCLATFFIFAIFFVVLLTPISP